jgi:hypothetical protein
MDEIVAAEHLLIPLQKAISYHWFIAVWRTSR